MGSAIKSTWNDERIAKAFIELAGETSKNDVPFIVANALIGYDIRYDISTLNRFGIKGDLSNISDIYNGDDSYKEFPADLINVQRLCQTLIGVSNSVGFGQPPCSQMWKKQCENILQ